MLVRDYNAADREACLSVFDSNVPNHFTPQERDQFGAFLDTLPGPYLVMVDDSGQVVGCGGYALEADGETVSLCWGMVRQDLHGNGHGELLLRERLRRIHCDSAAARVALYTSQHTRGFFERYGFTTERVESDGIAPGLDHCTMHLALPRRGHAARG